MGRGLTAVNAHRQPGYYERAVYFSIVTFTTLGYGDITLPYEEWRILSGVEALNGILLFGWTTAFLFAVVQRSRSSLAHGQAKLEQLSMTATRWQASSFRSTGRMAQFHQEKGMAAVSDVDAGQAFNCPASA